MFDDLRRTINKVRGDYSNNEDTSLAVGRRVVQNNLGIIYLGIAGLLLLGVLKFKSALLLLIYGGTPFVLDSSLVLESIPLVSRILPRVTILIEFGIDLGVASVGISLSVVYAIYKLIGAVKMGVPYYLSMKWDD